MACFESCGRVLPVTVFELCRLHVCMHAAYDWHRASPAIRCPILPPLLHGHINLFPGKLLADILSTCHTPSAEAIPTAALLGLISSSQGAKPSRHSGQADAFLVLILLVKRVY